MGNLFTNVIALESRKQAYSNAKAQTLANSQGRSTNKDVMSEYLKTDAGKVDKIAKNYNNLDVSQQGEYDEFLKRLDPNKDFKNMEFNVVAGRKL